MHLTRVPLLAAAWTTLALTLTAQAQLDGPHPINAGDAPLDVEHFGHAAPFVGDFDGDGVRDLLVGEYYQGRLRIYRNRGTNAEPRFADYSILHDGAETGRVPAS